jgi:hypothetical protein
VPDIRRRAQGFWTALFVAMLHIAVFALLPMNIKVPGLERASAFEYVFIAPPDSATAAHPHPTFPASPSAIEHRKPSLQAPDSLSLVAPLDETRDDSPNVDWNAELQRAGKDHSLREPDPALRDFGFPHRPAPAAAKSREFGWDYAATHRVESLPEGGLLINLNDRCVLLLAPLPFAFCGIGTKKANGDLFEHMQDAAAGPDQNALP